MYKYTKVKLDKIEAAKWFHIISPQKCHIYLNVHVCVYVQSVCVYV